MVNLRYHFRYLKFRALNFKNYINIVNNKVARALDF